MEGLEAKNKPVAVLEQLEQTSPAKAGQGLRMAINDCLEMSSGWSAERVRALDKEMMQAGVVTLSEMRGRYSRAYSRVLSRGKINSEIEYYLIKGVREFGGGVLDAMAIENLERLLQIYEGKINRQKN